MFFFKLIFSLGVKLNLRLSVFVLLASISIAPITSSAEPFEQSSQKVEPVINIPEALCDPSSVVMQQYFEKLSLPVLSDEDQLQLDKLKQIFRWCVEAGYFPAARGSGPVNR